MSTNTVTHSLQKTLTIAEVAEALAIGETKARTLCESGELPAKNIGTATRKIWRIKPECLAAYIGGQSVQSVQPQPAAHKSDANNYV